MEHCVFFRRRTAPCSLTTRSHARSIRLTLSDTLSDITSTGVRNVRKSAIGQSRTHCQTLPQHVSKKSENRQSYTVSELCSRHVRFSLKGCPKINNRTVAGLIVRLYLKACPIFPQGVSENRQPDSNRTRCRTLPQQVSETSENRPSDTVSELCSRRVRFSLKGCPILGFTVRR